MPYNDDIPGWMPEVDLKTLELLARRVPENGLIVEIGSYLGRSSWTLAKSCHPSVKVVCIDIWSDEWKPRDHPSSEEYSMDTFLKNVEDCPNIEAIRSGSTDVDWPENRKADLVFIDADHTSPQVDLDIEFWAKRVKSTGTLAGHDFDVNAWPDVCHAVMNISDQLDLPFKMYDKGFIWFIDFDPSMYPNDGWVPNNVLLDWIKEQVELHRLH